MPTSRQRDARAIGTKIETSPANARERERERERERKKRSTDRVETYQLPRGKIRFVSFFSLLLIKAPLGCSFISPLSRQENLFVVLKRGEEKRKKKRVLCQGSRTKAEEDKKIRLLFVVVCTTTPAKEIKKHANKIAQRFETDEKTNHQMRRRHHHYIHAS